MATRSSARKSSANPASGTTDSSQQQSSNEGRDQHIHDFYRQAVENLARMDVSATVQQQAELLSTLQTQAQHLMPPMLQQGQALRGELAKAYQQMLAQMVTHPHEVMRLQTQYWEQVLALHLHLYERTSGLTNEPAPVPDKRMSGTAWTANPAFDFLRHAYHIQSQAMLDMVETFAPTDPEAARKLKFAVKQYVDATSPANFALTNPEAIAKAVETRGESLLRGIQHLIHDMAAGRITMTDGERFAVGKNIAATPGSVVFENRLCQLIQYTPSTDKVQELPLLILPPWINKYYILDLAPDTSLIKYLVGEGYTVFVVSWKNIGPAEADITWEDYLQLGGLDTIEAVLRICGVPKLNLIGYCIGGTLTACLLSILKSRRQDIINTVTFFTAMVDFTDPGELSVYVDEAQQLEREGQYGKGGVFSGNTMANAFAFLRANDLVYNYVQNNYLLGKDYTPFDLLYWNSDPTNLAGPMYCWYLRNMYLENNLTRNGKLELLGHRIDVGQVEVPVLSVCTREDHIAPWHTVYKGAKAFGGPVEVVLGASGHIAGVVNPPAKGKREFWYGGELRSDHNHWLATAHNQKGSWWPYLIQWLGQRNHKQVPARTKLGNTQFPIIEPAPGRYVTEPLPVV